MEDVRDLHPVSTKAALFSEDRKHVLVTKMFFEDGHIQYGLPGGHVDGDEQPDDTIRRELREELGIMVGALQRADFFRHHQGKIVLGYTALIRIDTPMAPSFPHQEIGVWQTEHEFRATSSEPYTSFVLQCWARNLSA